MADVIGYAMLQVAPTIQGIQGNLQAQLGGPLVTAGRRAGQDAGQAIAGGIASARGAVEKASAALAKARDQEADAAGKIRVAEMKLEELRNSSRSTASQIAAAEERLETARRGGVRTADAATAAADGLAEAERRTAAATDESAASTENMGKKSVITTENLVKLGVLGATAVAGLATALFSVGSVFDDVSDTIRIGTGATGDALSALEQSAKNVGSTVPSSLESIGTTIADVNTRLGLTGPTLETFTSQILQAGNMLGEEIDINGLTASFTAFGVGGDQTVGVMDELFRVSQATGVGMNELAASAVKGAPQLQQFGFSLAESAGLVGSLDKAGLDADKTLGAMNKALVQFAKDGKEPQEALFGVVTEMQNLVDAGNDGAAIDLASGLFGTKGAGQFVQAVKMGTLSVDDFVSATGASSDTILGAASDTADFAEQWQLFKNNVLILIEPIASKVFGAISQGMGYIVDTGVPALQRFGEVVTGAFSEGGALSGVSKFGETLVSMGQSAFPVLVGAAQNLGDVLSGIGTGVAAVTQFFKDHEVVLGVVATVIGVGLVPSLVGLTATFATTAAGAVTSGITMTAAWISTQASAVASAGAQVLAQYRIVAGWVAGAAGAVTSGAIMVGQYVAAGASATLQAGIAAGAWVLASARTVGALALQGAAFVAQKAVLVAGTVATGAAAAAQWALNAAMSANPIGVLIVAITALVAGLVWFFTQTDTGKAIIQAAWEGIQTAISFAWNSVIQPIFGFFVAAFQKVGDIANWLWTSVIVPAWDGIGAAIGFAWNSIIMPAVDGVKAGFQAIGDIANWLWNNAIVPAWEGIKNATGTAWDFLRGAFDNIKSGFGAVGDFFGQVGDTIGGVWDGIVRGVAKGVNAIGKILQKIQIPDWVPGVGGKGTKGLGDTLVNWSAQYLASGGLVAGRRRDGTLFGPGTGTSDSIMGIGADGIPTAMVSAGEGVVKKSAMDSGGDRIIAALNAGWVPSPALLAMMTGLPAYADGGLIGSSMDWARSMDPVGYGMGGFSSSSIDCSGLVSGVVNTALGRGAFESRMSTVTEGEWLTERGATLGRGGPGDLRIGWWDQGGGANGHTAGTFPDGTNFESNGSEGVVIGGSTGADDPSFTDHAFFPASMFEGGDLGAAGGSGGGSAPDLSTSFDSDSGASTGGTSSGGFGSGGASSVGGTFSNEQGAIKVAAGDAMPVFVTNMPTGGFGGSSSDSAVPYSDAETAQSFSSDPVMPQSAPADSAPPVGGTGVDASYGAGEAGNPEVDKWSTWAQDVGQQWQKFGEDNWREMLNTAVGLGLGGIGGGGQTTVNNYGQDPRAVTKVLVRAQNRQSRAMQRSGGLTR